MSWLSDLQDTRDQIAAQLKDMTENPKPSYTVDGQAVRWTEHFKALTDAFQEISDAINSGEPYEEISFGYTP